MRKIIQKMINQRIALHSCASTTENCDLFRPSLDFLRMAASKGHVSAQVALGEALYEDRNRSASIAWLQAAAIAGSARAKLDLEGARISKAVTQQEKQQAMQSAFGQMMETIKKDVDAMNSPQKTINMTSGCRLPPIARAPFC
jgi:TPR repeat protein